MTAVMPNFTATSSIAELQALWNGDWQMPEYNMSGNMEQTNEAPNERNKGRKRKSDNIARSPNEMSTFLPINEPLPVPSSSTNANKIPRTTPVNEDPDAVSIVHESCRLYPTTLSIVRSALQLNPDCVHQKASTNFCSAENIRCCTRLTRKRKSTGAKCSSPPRARSSYPLNIALRHNPSLDVVGLLAKSAPEVLLRTDDEGDPNGYPSLSIALSQNAPGDVIALLLAVNAQSASVCDRRGNYPLHVACSKGYDVFVLHMLLTAYPQAIRKTNFHGHTPVEIAERSSFIKETAINYLQQKSYGDIEQTQFDI